LPEIGFDYGFMGKKNIEGTMPIICCRDKRTTSHGATAVPKKGRCDYATAYTAAFVRGLGYKRVVFRSDNERALLAMLLAVSLALPEVEVVTRTSPEGDHQANGLAELGVREAKGQVRVIMSQVEARYKRKIGHDEPLYAWAPRHAANSMNRFRIGSDGRTPEQRRTGRRWRRPIVEFGEQCMLRAVRVGGRKEDAEPRMVRGVYVGHHERTGASLFISPEGLKRGTGIHRMLEDERWNDEFLKSCSGLPWKPKPDKIKMDTPAYGAGEEAVAAPLPVIVGDPLPRPVRRMNVRRTDLDRYGATDGCRACFDIMAGHKTTVPHSEVCRARIQQAMDDDEDPVVQERVRVRTEASAARESGVDGPEVRVGEGGEAEVPAGDAAGAPDMDADGEAWQEEPARASDERHPRPAGASTSTVAVVPGRSAGPASGEPAAVRRRLEPPASPAARRAREEYERGALGSGIVSEQLKKRKEDARTGVKRPGTDIEDLEAHIDEDVVLPRAARENPAIGAAGGGASSSSAGPSAAAADPAPEDPSGPAADTLSLAKEELVDAAEQRLREIYAKEGYHELELQALSRDLVALTAIEPTRPQRKGTGAFTDEHALKPSFIVDLTAKKAFSGLYWDLSVNRDVELLGQIQKQEKPMLVIGSPPSVAYEALKSRPSYQKEQTDSSQKYLTMFLESCKRQLREGRHFLLELPTSSEGWQWPQVRALLKRAGTFTVDSKPCRWTLRDVSTQAPALTPEPRESREGGRYLRKEVRWLTSSWAIAEQLRDDAGLPRVLHALREDLLAPDLGPYILGQVVAGLRRQEEDFRGLNLGAFEAGPVAEEDVDFADPEDEEMFMDDVHGKVLDKKEVAAARKEEVDWVLKRQVIEVVPAAGHDPIKHGPLLDTRWVDTRKKSGIVRSRMCCREIKARAKLARGAGLSPEEVFSAMPPVESLKLLLALWGALGVDIDGEELCLGVWDVSRAHFYGKAKRELYIRLPDELAKPGCIGRLRKTMYGVRDASSIWLETWGAYLTTKGFIIGRANPALFHDKKSKGFCHGDDFVVLASRKKLEEFGRILEAEYEVKCQGIIGYGDGAQKEVAILNRVVRVVDSLRRTELEPDKRLVERIIKDYGLSTAKVVGTPRVKKSTEESLKAEKTPLLGPSEATRFRSATMRAQYLAQDRSDIAETVKCLSQHMAKPREAHVVDVKRLARYLKGKPHIVLTFPRSEEKCPNVLTLGCRSDSDWAGDAVTRRSTSGVTIRLQGALVRHSATLQAVTSLSSAEAEFYALSKAAQMALGLQSYLGDLGVMAHVELGTDSSGAKAFSERRGVGRMRHISTRYLWLQERIQAKHLRIRKVLGEDNEADVLTKALGEAAHVRWLRTLGYQLVVEPGVYCDP